MSATAQNQIDTRALEMAAEAKGRLQEHEDRCGERYREISEMFRELRAAMTAADTKRSEQFAAVYTKIDAIKAEAWNWRRSVYLGVIVVLLSVVGYLLVHGAPFVRQ